MSIPLRDKTKRGWHPEPTRMMSLAEHPQPPHRHAELARAGRLWVGVLARDWAAYLLPPEHTVTTQVGVEGVLRPCKRLAEGTKPFDSPPILVNGFWWLGTDDAHRVLRDGEAKVHVLCPPDPAALHQQWPDDFPDAGFYVMLEPAITIRKADLLWLADAPGPHGPLPLIPYEQAFARLNDRFNTTPGEVAMWISHTYPFADGNDRTDRLLAYRLPVLPDDPKLRDEVAVHGTSFLTEDDRTALSKLRGLFFPRETLEAFTPAVRWLTYEQLAARWGGEESRITDYIERTGNDPMEFWPHPTRKNAVLHECMFMLEQIERVEAVFGLRPVAVPKSAPIERSKREKKHHATERKNMLKLIVVLAEENNIDLRQPYTAGAALAELLADRGHEMSSDRLAEWIKDARGLQDSSE